MVVVKKNQHSENRPSLLISGQFWVLHTTMSFAKAMKDLNLEACDYDMVIVRSEYEIEDLDQLKTAIESQLGLLFDKLRGLSADMDTPLTVDGFPRADIDVVQVRLVRVRIIRLRNDLKEVLGLLEEKVATRFNEIDSSLPARDALQLVPFATISEVTPGGPAEEDGLHVGDRVLKFGRINVTNHRALANIPSQVAVGRPVEVIVDRAGQQITIELTPRQWSGRGVLGCRLVE